MENSKQRITVFCLAPGDVVHVLNLYDKHKDNAIISIFCFNVKPVYEYIESLSLAIDNIRYVENVNLSLKNPKSILRNKDELERKYNQNFKNINDEVIYFFGIWFDYVAFYFLSRLANNNNVIYCSYIKGITDRVKLSYSLKQYLTLSIYYYITGIHFNLADEKNFRLVFPYREYGIKKKNAENIDIHLLQKYYYKINNRKRKSILLFESDLKDYDLYKNYKKKIVELLKIIKSKGYFIYLKGHPRLGSTLEVEQISDYILPKEIPAELIDVSFVDIIMGIESSIIAYLSKKYTNIYSLIYLFEYSKIENQEQYVDFLFKNSNQKIKFISNLEMFNKMLTLASND